VLGGIVGNKVLFLGPLINSSTITFSKAMSFVVTDLFSIANSSLSIKYNLNVDVISSGTGGIGLTLSDILISSLNVTINKITTQNISKKTYNL
jgi:hypothetical protein